MKNLQLAITSIILAIVTALTVRLWPLVNYSEKAVCSDREQPAVTVASSVNQSLKYNLAAIQQSAASENPIPETIKENLVAIEDKLTKEESWPQSAAGVTLLHDQLATTLNQLPPRTQEELLPSLVPLRWTIQAFWLLFNPPPENTDSVGLSTYAGELESLASNRPLASSENLVARLIAKQKEVREQAMTKDRSDAIKESQVAIGEKGDIDQAIRRISGFEDKEARELLYQLGLIRDLQAISDDFQMQEKLVDPILREFALGRLNQGILDLRLRVAVSKVEVPKTQIEKLVEMEKKFRQQQAAVSKARQDDFTNKRRDYQVWALSEIKKVPLLATLDAEEKEKIGVLDRNNPMSNAYKNAAQTAKNKLSESMIKNMAFIDTTFLDESVATWYRKVFQQRFGDLDEASQFAVITGFSTKIKATFSPPAKL